MKTKTFTVVILVAFIFGYSTLISQADTVTFNLNFEFSGATAPEGTPPWLRATFDDGGGTGTVILTLNAINLTGSEFVRIWDFNFDPSLNAALLGFAQNSGPPFQVASLGNDAWKADGDGFFDIEIQFANSGADRFQAGESAEFEFTMAGITANSFNFLSAPGGGQGSFHTAAHVQGIGTEGEGSGWIGDTNGTNGKIPEPISLILLGSGLAGAGLYRRLRKPKS